MIYFLKHLKGIAYFLIMLILFQSCVVYKDQYYTSSEASTIDKRIIKIKTNEGEKYKLPWIEEKDGNVVSIKKTRRKYIDKNEIDKILIYNPVEIVVSLDTAINHEGKILIRTAKFSDQHPYVLDSYNYSFLKIIDEGDYIKGYKMTGKDTLAVSVPISDIKKIKVENKAGTIVLSALGAFIFTVSVVTIASMRVTF